METHQQTWSEVMFPVLEHGKLHFGSGCGAELKIMIKIAISHGPHYGQKTSSAMEMHQQKSSEVIIHVLQHV